MQNPEQLTKLATALGGLPVLGCRPGSPAARAGIRYGDIVLAINGMPTPDWAAYGEGKARDTQRMAARVFRGGAELELDFALEPALGTPAEAASWLAYLAGS